VSVITDWTAEKAQAFTREALTFGHDLHTRPMFDDEGLARALHAYPRERLGVFTMGEDPVDWRSWRRGAAGDLSGDKLLDAAKAGRIWLNLREANRHLPDYEALCGEIFADKSAHAAGVRTFKRDVGLLISSARAQVFYHLDMALVSLWQLRGHKRVWVYPVAEPFIGDAQLERIALRETAEQFAYEPAWDAAAEVYDLSPGDMVTWTQNAPHRIENGEMLNVSLSIEFMTPTALMRANVIYANGVLRRAVGLKPQVQRGIHPVALAKLALARTVKAAGLRKAFEVRVPPSFTLDAARPGVLTAAPA
jgi:hypothetical protein